MYVILPKTILELKDDQIVDLILTTTSTEDPMEILRQSPESFAMHVGELSCGIQVLRMRIKEMLVKAAYLETLKN